MLHVEGVKCDVFVGFERPLSTFVPKADILRSTTILNTFIASDRVAILVYFLLLRALSVSIDLFETVLAQSVPDTIRLIVDVVDAESVHFRTSVNYLPRAYPLFIMVLTVDKFFDICDVGEIIDLKSIFRIDFFLVVHLDGLCENFLKVAFRGHIRLVARADRN